MLGILEQFKAYVYGAVLVIILTLASSSMYLNSRVNSLVKENATLEAAVKSKDTTIQTCSDKTKEFNKAQDKASADAAIAVEKAKKDAKDNYSTSREFGGKIPKTNDDYTNTTDLINQYIDKRQSGVR